MKCSPTQFVFGLNQLHAFHTTHNISGNQAIDATLLDLITDINRNPEDENIPDRLRHNKTGIYTKVLFHKGQYFWRSKHYDRNPDRSPQDRQ
jgi:hypothetical protein